MLEMKRAGDRARDQDDIEVLEGIQGAGRDRD
jgi:hypothetical protein